MGHQSDNEIHVKTWEDFENEIRKIQRTNEASILDVLFRGHASANWLLDTTLERRVKEPMTFQKHYGIIAGIKPAVETFTNSIWNLPEWQAISEWATSYDARRNPNKIVLAYDYLAHLRIQRVSFAAA